jgi:hypothetical protein
MGDGAERLRVANNCGLERIAAAKGNQVWCTVGLRCECNRFLWGQPHSASCVLLAKLSLSKSAISVVPFVKGGLVGVDCWPHGMCTSGADCWPLSGGMCTFRVDCWPEACARSDTSFLSKGGARRFHFVKGGLVGVDCWPHGMCTSGADCWPLSGGMCTFRVDCWPEACARSNTSFLSKGGGPLFSLAMLATVSLLSSGNGATRIQSRL